MYTASCSFLHYAVTLLVESERASRRVSRLLESQLQLEVQAYHSTTDSPAARMHAQLLSCLLLEDYVVLLSLPLVVVLY